MIALIMAFEDFLGANKDHLDKTTVLEIERAIKDGDVDALMAQGTFINKVADLDPEKFNGADKLALGLTGYAERVKFRAGTQELLEQCRAKGYLAKKKGTLPKSS